MRTKLPLCIIVFMSLLANSLFAQQRLHFSIADFHLDPLALTARSEQFKRMDDNGVLYSIIKVKSNLPDDDLRSYRFDFGLMNSFVELHDDDGELWVYVQKNAKTVTIRREGYATVSKYDLQTTIDAGCTYEMLLSVSGPQVYMQMVMFSVKPTTAKAFVTVKAERQDAIEEVLGMVDETGAVAKSLPFGSYTYRVAAENYYPSEGRFTLNNQEETHIEDVALRGNFGTITLQMDSDADIYVDGERKGVRSWTGVLKAGSHQVECRQANHTASMQTITVVEDETRTISLTSPSPITGTLSITSRPLRADIKIDGKDYGQTPKMITDLLVGRHTVELITADNKAGKQEFEIKDGQTTNVEVELTLQNNYATENGEDREFTVTGNGKTITFKMVKVKAGTFQMGSANGDDDEKPVHQVTLTKDYFMGETEVTQGLWYAVMGQSPTSDGSTWDSSSGLGDNYPAYYINYEDCQQFLTKLNQLTGRQFRFPTEAEWEFAARGGTKSQGYTYAGSNTLGSVAWYTDNSGSKTHEVKTKAANELGLYDMSGNVSEWCLDGYGSYSSSAQTNPTGPSTGSSRVLRGGDLYEDAWDCRVAYRGSSTPSYTFFTLGLRLAL